MPERIHTATSLTDDTIEMKYTSAQADLETVPRVGGEGWVAVTVSASAMRGWHSSLSIIQTPQTLLHLCNHTGLCCAHRKKAESKIIRCCCSSGLRLLQFLPLLAAQLQRWSQLSLTVYPRRFYGKPKMNTENNFLWKR